MTRRLEAIARLNWRQRLAALKAALALVIVKACLALFGYGRTRRVLDTLSPRAHTQIPDTDSRLQSIPELSWMVAGVSFYASFDTTCLERTLTLWWLLSMRRIDSDIRIGTARRDDGIVAHAWLERNGVVVNDDADAIGQYQAFDRLK